MQVAVRQQHLDKRSGAAGVTMGLARGNPKHLMGGGEHLGRASLHQRCGPGQHVGPIAVHQAGVSRIGRWVGPRSELLVDQVVEPAAVIAEAWEVSSRSTAWPSMRVRVAPMHM